MPESVLQYIFRLFLFLACDFRLSSLAMYSIGVLNFVLKIFKKQIILLIILRKAIWKCETDLYSVLLYVVIDIKKRYFVYEKQKIQSRLEFGQSTAKRTYNLRNHKQSHLL